MMCIFFHIPRQIRSTVNYISLTTYHMSELKKHFKFMIEYTLEKIIYDVLFHIPGQSRSAANYTAKITKFM